MRDLLLGSLPKDYDLLTSAHLNEVRKVASHRKQSTVLYSITKGWTTHQAAVLLAAVSTCSALHVSPSDAWQCLNGWPSL